MSYKQIITVISLNDSDNDSGIIEQGYDIIEYYNKYYKKYYKKYYNERAYYNRIIGLDID
jgi:hypothetical protein